MLKSNAEKCAANCAYSKFDYKWGEYKCILKEKTHRLYDLTECEKCEKFELTRPIQKK